MKKYILYALCFIISTSMYSQNKISWEGQIGLNIAKINVTGFNSKVGFNIGARGQLDLPSLFDGVYANAGALLSLKGASFNFGGLADAKINAYYLDIPVHMGYQYEINDKFSVFGEFGPYFALGLFGKSKSAGMQYDEDWEMTKAENSENTFDILKRFDFGLGFRLGATFKNKYILSLGYDFGLMDCYKDDEMEDIVSEKNRNLSISLGYKF